MITDGVVKVYQHYLILFQNHNMKSHNLLCIIENIVIL